MWAGTLEGDKDQNVSTLEIILKIGYNTIQKEDDFKMIYDIIGFRNICRPLSGVSWIKSSSEQPGSSDYQDRPLNQNSESPVKKASPPNVVTRVTALRPLL